MMNAGHKNTNENRRLQAETLRHSAMLANSEESPLAVEYWNHACQRIAQRLEAQAAKLEKEVTDSSATLGRRPLPHPRHRWHLISSPRHGSR